ncbi:MAG TPA: DUF748 domain-containing protein [Porticoccaceae bacterium]|nr:DUF748 domain-containing protein [Porticoccaceae bacterium]
MRRLLRKHRLWLAVAVLVLSYTAAGFLLVPWLLRDQLLGYLREDRGLTADLGPVSFNPYLFQLRLRDLAVHGRDGAPLLALREGFVDVDPSWLVRGIWRVQALRLDAPALNLERRADGGWNVAALLPPSATEPQPEGPPATMPRVSVGEIFLGEGRLGYAEPGRTPAFRQELTPIEFHVTELGTLPNARGDYRLTLGIAGGELRVSGSAGLAPLAVDAQVAVRDVSLVPVAEYLGSHLPLQLLAGSAGLTAAVAVAPGPQLEVRELAAEVAALKLAMPAGEPLLEVPRLALSGGALAWPQQRVDVAAITLTGARLSTWLDPDRPFSLLQLVAKQDGAQPGTATAATAAETAAAETTAAMPPPQGSPWQVALKQLRFEQAEIAFTDRTLPAPATQHVQIEALDITDIGNAPDARFGVNGTLHINDAGNITVQGSVAPTPLVVALDLTLAELLLAPATPYLQRVLHSAITEGSLDGTLALRLADDAGAALSGELAVAELVLEDQLRDRPWLRWQRLDIAGLDLQLQPEPRLRIRDIQLRQPWLDVSIRKDGTSNLGRMRVTAPVAQSPPGSGSGSGLGPAAGAAPAAESAAAGEPVTPAPAAPLPVIVEQFQISEGALKFRDFNLPLPFAVQTHSLNGTLRHFSNRPDARVDLKLQGGIDRYGEARIVARTQPAAPRQFSEFELHFDNVDFRSVSPYSAKFAGYAIESGTLRLDLEYRIENNRLRGENRVLLNQLLLGDEVDAPGATKLPLHLAVALLKDAQGNIDLDLPVRGDLSDPRVGVGRLVWQAFTNLIVKAATAPFAVLGRLVGADAGELDAVGFGPGAAELTPSQREVLDRLARALAKRPGIGVAFGGCTLAEPDAEGLRTSKLEALLAAHGAKTRKGGADAVVRAAFIASFSKAEWKALAADHPDAPAALAEAARERLLAAQPLEQTELAALAAARRDLVLGYLRAQPGVKPEQVVADDQSEGRKREERVQCRLKPRAR